MHPTSMYNKSSKYSRLKRLLEKIADAVVAVDAAVFAPTKR